MDTPARDQIVEETNDDQHVCQSKEGWWARLQNANRKPSDGRSQNCNCCQHHKSLVHIWPAAKIETRSPPTSKPSACRKLESLERAFGRATSINIPSTGDGALGPEIGTCGVCPARGLTQRSFKLPP